MSEQLQKNTASTLRIVEEKAYEIVNIGGVYYKSFIPDDKLNTANPARKLLIVREVPQAIIDYKGVSHRIILEPVPAPNEKQVPVKLAAKPLDIKLTKLPQPPVKKAVEAQVADTGKKFNNTVGKPLISNKPVDKSAPAAVKKPPASVTPAPTATPSIPNFDGRIRVVKSSGKVVYLPADPIRTPTKVTTPSPFVNMPQASIDAVIGDKAAVSVPLPKPTAQKPVELPRAKPANLPVPQKLATTPKYKPKPAAKKGLLERLGWVDIGPREIRKDSWQYPNPIPVIGFKPGEKLWPDVEMQITGIVPGYDAPYAYLSPEEKARQDKEFHDEWVVPAEKLKKRRAAMTPEQRLAEDREIYKRTGVQPVQDRIEELKRMGLTTSSFQINAWYGSISDKKVNRFLLVMGSLYTFYNYPFTIYWALGIAVGLYLLAVFWRWVHIRRSIKTEFKYDPKSRFTEATQRDIWERTRQRVYGSTEIKPKKK